MSTVQDQGMSPGDGGRLSELALRLRGYQQALDEFDEAIAELLGVNRTDLRCLDLLSTREPLSAGELGRAAGLSSGAVTFLLDRLERRGLIRRRRAETDRRKVLIEFVPEARELAWSLHWPLVRAMRKALRRFGREDLEVIEGFLALGEELYREHARRLRSERSAAGEAGRSGFGVASSSGAWAPGHRR